MYLVCPLCAYDHPRASKQRGILLDAQRGIFGGPDGGVYLGPQRVYISGSQKRLFWFQQMFFFRRARLGNTCSYIWCTTSSVEPNLNFTRCDEQILFLSKVGIRQCGVWYKDPPMQATDMMNLMCVSGAF